MSVALLPCASRGAASSEVKNAIEGKTTDEIAAALKANIFAG